MSICIEPLLRSQLIDSLLANQANLILLVFHLLRHMITRHVDLHGIVIAYTCQSALQIVASAFCPKCLRADLQHSGANIQHDNNTEH